MENTENSWKGSLFISCKNVDPLLVAYDGSDWGCGSHGTEIVMGLGVFEVADSLFEWSKHGLILSDKDVKVLIEEFSLIFYVEIY